VTNVYEWVASNVPPAQYVSNAANGFVTATAAYVFNTATNTYYFWVYNKGTLGPIYSVSSANLATQLQNIANTGIALASPIDDNRIGVWNVNQYIAAYTAVLHVDYVVAEGDSDLHSEFLLLSNSGQKSWLRTPIYQKFIDSISGQNSSGAMVPNMNLLNDQQYGTSVAPVRTIFVNRAAALLSYYSEINTQLANVAVATTNTVKLLSTKAPLPTYGFSITVPDRATLNSLNIDDYPQNYRVLVLSDNTLRNNPWSVVAGTSGAWQVVQMQSYDLSAMWEYADWTAPGFANTTPTFTINSPADFPSVSIGLGQTLGVSDNDGASNYAVYQNNVGNISVITDLDLVFLENGTLQFLPSLYNYAASNIGFDLAPFDQVRYFDDEPVNEIQLITAALNEQILVGNWSYIADAAFFAGLNYIIHENQNLDWLFKTSFITVNYPVKNLDNPTTFSATDDTTMSDFITETMPFHTRVREFIDGYSSNLRWTIC